MTFFVIFLGGIDRRRRGCYMSKLFVDHQNYLRSGESFYSIYNKKKLVMTVLRLQEMFKAADDEVVLNEKLKELSVESN